MIVWYILTILIIIGLLILITAIYWYYIQYQYRSLCDIPGPKPLPIIGNLMEVSKSPSGLFGALINLTAEYGSTFKVWKGNKPVIITIDPKHAEALLKSNIHITKSLAYDLIKPWLGDGLLVSTGKKWKGRRKMLTPSYHFNILEKFVAVFDSSTNILVQKLKELGNETEIDIYPYVNLCSLDIICETSMGISINAQLKSCSEYTSSVREFLELVGDLVLSPKLNLIFFKWTKKYAKYKDCLKKMNSFADRVISKRRQDLKNDKSIKIEQGAKVALLDTLLMETETSKMLSNEDIRDEINTFMFEGHDTVSSGIAFAFYEISKRPEIQEKIYEEIIYVAGTDKNVKLTHQHLQNMKYLERVLKEVQRLYPSVPLIGRTLEQDFYLDKHKIPKGTGIGIFIYGLHRCKENHNNPEEFNPDRFLPENQRIKHAYSFIPFSAGPRNCIGQKFALLEMKATIIKVLQNFELLPVPNKDVKLINSVVLKSTNGVNIKLKRR